MAMDGNHASYWRIDIVPQISVVITTHNRPHMVERAVRSALAQTFLDREIVVVDDASESQTTDVLTPYQERGEIRLIRIEHSKGANNARAVGASEARAPYLAYLDDDDSWEPSKLERQSELIGSDEEISLIGCGWQTETKTVVPPRNISYEALLSENLVGSFSVGLFRKSNLEESGGFDLSLTNAQDWDVWLRLAKTGKVAVVPDILVRLNTSHAGRISLATDKEIYYRNYKQVTDNHAHAMDSWTQWRHKYTVIYHTTPFSHCLRKLWSGIALLVTRKVDQFNLRRQISMPK